VTALEWPKVLVPPTVDIHYDARTISGGVSLSGKEQIASRDFGIWRATLERVAIRRRDQVLAWRALLVGLDGRVGTVLVPLFDRSRAPWAYDQYGRRLDPAFSRDPSLDGTQFADAAGLVDGLISAKGQSAAAARAASIDINIMKGSIPEPGMHFSIGNRAYRIRAVTNVAGTVVTCNIRPGLREAVSAGAVVNFTSPVCEMRLTSDDQGRAGLDMWKFAAPSFEFVEA